jgi:hypothetical protein
MWSISQQYFKDFSRKSTDWICFTANIGFASQPFFELAIAMKKTQYLNNGTPSSKDRKSSSKTPPRLLETNQYLNYGAPHNLDN